VVWNKGLRTATNWNDSEAWWNSRGDLAEDEEVEIVEDVEQVNEDVDVDMVE
jgi:hypothetical protein